jgi:hypothetical protein
VVYLESVRQLNNSFLVLTFRSIVFAALQIALLLLVRIAMTAGVKPRVKETARTAEIWDTKVDETLIAYFLKRS